MEKHRCKLCLKSFANGRALGGHMRSHMVNLYVPPKAEHHHHHHQLDEEAESASSSSSSDAEEEENGDKDLFGSYELRENPKKSIRLVDPEFSFAAEVGSVVLQDRESETESSKNNPIRRRSKRIRKSGISEHHHRRHQCQEHQEIKKLKSGKAEASSWAEQEPVSSISDAATEEDVAYCLMMLSRDKWMRDDDDEEAEAEEYSKKWLEEEEDNQTDDGSEELKQSKGTRARGKYKCESCHKVFRSYQALGGHRASHKKRRGVTHLPLEAGERRNAGTNSEQKKTHECPVCFRVFSSGQALGGHKRSHVLGSAPAPPPPHPKKNGELLIDLNLPAPIDEDDISQIELSAVSDAEFVDQIIKH